MNQLSVSASQDAAIEAARCGMKLWRLQPLFRRLASSWHMEFDVDRSWPGIFLCRKRLLLCSRLELRLQPDFLRFPAEYYEIRYRETGLGMAGRSVRHDFGCGRLDDDEVLSEARVVRALHHRANLLGLLPPDKALDATLAAVRHLERDQVSATITADPTARF